MLPDGLVDQSERIETNGVSVLDISQATTAIFTDLYFRQTFLFFIERGSKLVSDPVHGDLVGEAGDLMIFPAGAMVTMINRPLMNQSYKATGVSYTRALTEIVFPRRVQPSKPPTVRVLRADEHAPARILRLLRDTLTEHDLPQSIRESRMLEPLVWLKDAQIDVPTQGEDSPVSQVRRIIDADLSYPWRASDVASELAMSEASMRRLLSSTGQGFARILQNSRLERGLTLLQTTQEQVSSIALDCGFKTPSHFADAFRQRFGIKPKDIRSAANLIEIR
ncbi:helix-turn-helix transcriptional regulator [Roseobacter sp. A03A-229]